MTDIQVLKLESTRATGERLDCTLDQLVERLILCAYHGACCDMLELEWEKRVWKRLWIEFQVVLAGAVLSLCNSTCPGFLLLEILLDIALVPLGPV